MKFRTGLIIGLGVGYVLGARAGRERYEQIKSAVDGILGNENVQKATAVADRTTQRARTAAGNGLVSASNTVRDRVAASG